MRHFIIEVIYTASIEKIEETRQEHRNFLKTLYEKKIILISGPEVPRIGGIIIARGESMEEISDYFRNDPYQINGLADYRYVEFRPANYQEILKVWVEK